MPLHRVKALLLLLQDPAALRRGAVALLIKSDRLYNNRQILAAKRLVQFLAVRLCIVFGTAQRVLHITGARLCTVFIISVSAEGQPHGFDIVKDFFRLDRLGHPDAKAGIVPKTARAVYVEQPVRPCRKA